VVTIDLLPRLAGHTVRAVSPILGPMRSVADDLKKGDRETAARLSAEQRVALALALGDADLDALQHARGIDRAAAIRVFERQRQAGRTPSACMRAVIG
jgi:hypothetical protein